MARKNSNPTVVSPVAVYSAALVNMVQAIKDGQEDKVLIVLPGMETTKGRTATKTKAAVAPSVKGVKVNRSGFSHFLHRFIDVSVTRGIAPTPLDMSGILCVQDFIRNVQENPESSKRLEARQKALSRYHDGNGLVVGAKEISSRVHK